MKNYIAIFVLSILLVSCNKVTNENLDGPNYTTTVTGYALTTDSLNPIKGLRLNINPLQGSYTTIATGQTVRTDSTGKFSFIYTGPRNGRVGIGFSGSSTFHNYGGYDYITPYYTSSHNIHLQPYGWLKLHVENINPWNGDDVFGVSAGSQSEILYGLADNHILWKVPGNGRIIIDWGVTRNGLSAEFADTIYLPGFDTTFYEILY